MDQITKWNQDIIPFRLYVFSPDTSKIASMLQ